MILKPNSNNCQILFICHNILNLWLYEYISYNTFKRMFLIHTPPSLNSKLNDLSFYLKNILNSKKLKCQVERKKKHPH